jgi:phosphate transport system substrate-binding protein
MKPARLLVAALGVLGACQDQASGSGARAQITVVGSSTVYPFTTVVAEQFVASDPDAATPVIEATGTGAGLKLFCGGVGPRYPDIANASRRMKPSEYASCSRNGAGDILEIQLGIDGIALAAAKNGPRLTLNPATLYRAIAATPGARANTARTWADIDTDLPPTPIRVYGPPSTSGTRDALSELILTPGCDAVDPAARALAARDPDAHRALCTRVRDDGHYVDSGENDNFVVQKLRADPQAIGVVGYSYLVGNGGAVNGIALSGVAPSYAAIADGRYPGARPLFLYVKRAHLGAVPGLRAFLRLYAAAWGPGGALARHGLIVAPAAVRARSAAVVARETPLDPRMLDRG